MILERICADVSDTRTRHFNTRWLVDRQIAGDHRTAFGASVDQRELEFQRGAANRHQPFLWRDSARQLLDGMPDAWPPSPSARQTV